MLWTTVQNIEEEMGNNADEAANLDFDLHSDVDLNMTSDADEDPSWNFYEEQPHFDAMRKRADWAADQNVSHCAGPNRT